MIRTTRTISYVCIDIFSYFRISFALLLCLSDFLIYLFVTFLFFILFYILRCRVVFLNIGIN